MKLKDLYIKKPYWQPLILSLALLIVDQISKALVVKYIPIWTFPTSANRVKVFGDFLCFIHVRNLGAGFSFGADFVGFWRVLVIFVLPILVMLLVLYIVLAGREKFGFKTNQVWFFAVVLAGGIGTLIDRLFRPLGVVDFISVKFYGFLGFEYWPTFNISDSCVVVGVLALIISFLCDTIKNGKKSKDEVEQGKNG